MASNIFKVFVVIVSLFMPTLGQNSQQHLICKNVDSVFSDAQDGSAVSQPRTIQARTGKRGPAGVKGERGLPGIKGQPGSPAVVDYERIFQVIEEKHREGMKKVESRFEELKRNITQFERELVQRSEETTTTATTTTTTMTTDQARGQRCKEENGFTHNGKCYTAYISSSFDTNYNEAVQKCTSRNSLIAELHSLAHQKAIQDFIRPRIPSSRNSMWIAMTYQRAGRNLRFRSGEEVSVDQFKWYSGYPFDNISYDKIAIYVEKDGNESGEGMFNVPATNSRHGVICEKLL